MQQQQQQQQRFETKKSRLVFWSQQENEDIELWLGFQWEGGLVSPRLGFEWSRNKNFLTPVFIFGVFLLRRNQPF